MLKSDWTNKIAGDRAELAMKLPGDVAAVRQAVEEMGKGRE